jgi:copper chaperone CopZ
MACGHCLEDRVASVYDHALVEHSKLHKQTLMYLVWDGPVDRSTATRQWLLKTIGAVPGVVVHSVRVSIEPPTIALAYDPLSTRAADLEKALQAKLAAKGLTASSLPM